MSALAGEITAALAPVFQKWSDRVAAAYLFGSCAKGEAGPGSDVDLALLLRDRTGAAGLELRLDIYADCSRALKRNDIDLIVLNTTRNLYLIEDVIRNGIVIYQTDVEFREEFEVNAMHDFIDFVEHRKRIYEV